MHLVALIVVLTVVALYLVWAEPWRKQRPARRGDMPPPPPVPADLAPSALNPPVSQPGEARTRPDEDEITFVAKGKPAAAAAHDDDITMVGRVPAALVALSRSGENPKAGADAHADDDMTLVGAVPAALLGKAVRPEDKDTARPPPMSDDMDVDVDGPPPSDPTGPQARILVTAVAHTDTGRRRAQNEDSYLSLDDFSLYVVADGMGGYAGGELASQLACETVERAFRADRFEGEAVHGRPRRGDELARSIAMANRAIFNVAQGDRKLEGMGTTIVAIRFSPNKQRAYYAHVGDSRLYRVRGGVMEQLTRDHTIGEATGVTGPLAARLTRAVGIASLIEVEFGADDPQVGDTYLLCSDGLTKMLADDEALDILNEERDLDRCARRLVETANDHGGRDNVTVVLIRIAAP
ncbi:MAG: serine/threonine-protein phosphatase [Polyangiaceae bacterium]|nr:serine/threonine-protein phosphatase [Polyangiaceae bacterium]